MNMSWLHFSFLWFQCIYLGIEATYESDVQRQIPYSISSKQVVISKLSSDNEISKNLKGYSGNNIQTGENKYIVEILGQNLILSSGLKSFNKHSILLINNYTKHPSECVCASGGMHLYMDCDCCIPGFCQCPNIQLCAPCGHPRSECIPEGINLQNSKTVVSIRRAGNQKTLLTAEGGTLITYHLVNHTEGYYLIKKRNFFNFNKRIAAVRYGETFSYSNYQLTKRKFVILLIENTTKHLFYEMGENISEGVMKKIPWFTPKPVSAKDFNVFQNSGKIMVCYTVDDTMHINILQEYNGGEFKITPVQKFHVPGVTAWNYYNGEDQKLLATFGSPFTILFELGTQYNGLQIFSNPVKYGSPLQIFLQQVGDEDSLILTMVWSCRVEFHIQQKDNGTFQKVHFLEYPSCSIKSASTFEFQDSSYVTLQKKYDQSEVILLYKTKEDSIPVADTKKKALLERVEKYYENQIASLDKIEQNLNAKISALKNLEYESKENEPSLTKLNYDLRRPYSKLTEIEHKMSKVEYLLKTSEKDMRDLVYLEGPHKLIQGDKYVKNAVVDHLIVENAYLPRRPVNRTESIEDTLQKLVLIDDKRIIMGNKILKGNITVQDMRCNYINGIDVNTIVKEDRESEIEGATFSNSLIVKGNIEVQESRTIFDVDLSAEAISMQDTAKLGKCSFVALNALNGVYIEENRINNDHIDDLLASSIQEEYLTYPANAYFTNLTILGNLKADSIMYTDVKRFLDNIINLKENEYLKNIILNDVKVTNLMATSINNEVYPTDFVTKRLNVTDFGQKTFDKVVFGDLSVVGDINGINTDLVVTTSTYQKISGTKTFMQGVNIFGNLNINSSKIDNVDLSFVENESDSSETDLNRIYGSKITVSNLKVKGAINNGKLLSVLNDLAYSHDGIISITGKKEFNSLKIKNGTIIDTINYIKVDSFVDTKSENTINDKKIFIKDLSFSNIRVIDKVDGTDLNELFANALYNNERNQVVTGLKRVGAIMCKEINVNSSINGILTREFLLKDAHQQGESFSFRDVVFDSLKVNKIRLPETAKVNDFLLGNIDRDIGIDSFNPVLMVRGNVTVKQWASASTINNNSVKKLFHVLEEKKTNKLYGNINFDYLTVDGSLRSDGLIGKINISELTSNSVKKFGNNLIRHSTWEEIKVPSILVDGNVNNIDFRRLADDVVFTDEKVPYFRGEKAFANGCRVKGNLEAKLINSKDFSKNILLKNKRQIITANYSFQGIKIQDAKIGFFNNLSLRNLSKSDVPTLEIKGSQEFTGYVSSRSIEVNGFVNNLDIKAIMKDSVRINSSNIGIKGKKTFYKPVIFSNLDINRLNTQIVDYETLRNKSFVTKLNKLNVHGRLIAKSMKVVTTNIEGEFQNFSDHIASKVIRITDDVQNLLLSDVHVLGDLKVGKLNDLNVEEDFLSKKDAQNFMIHAYIGKANFKNLTVFGLINDLRMETKIAISDGVIRKRFEGRVRLNEDLIINGNVTTVSLGQAELAVPDDLILTIAPQRVSGQLNFIRPVTANKISMSSYVLNGMDISPISFPGLYTDYFYMDNFNLTRETLKVSLKETLKLECNKTATMQNILRNALVVPYSIKLISKSKFLQENELLPEYMSHSEANGVLSSITAAFQAFSSLWIIQAVSPNFCSAIVYKYDEDGILQRNYNLSNIGQIREFIILEETNEKVTMLAVSSGATVCGNRGSSLWRAKIPVIEMKKIGQDYPAADAVTVDSSGQGVDIYFKSGDKIYMYQYQNGILNEVKEPGAYIEFARFAHLSDGSSMTAKLINGIDIIISRESVITSKTRLNALFKDIRIMEYQNEILLLISVTRKDLFEEKSYLYISKNVEYKQRLLWSIPLDKPAKLLPFKMLISNAEYSFFILLQEYTTPKIFIMRGLSAPELWQELEIILRDRVWAQILEDVNRTSTRIIIGDLYYSYLMQVQLNGMNYINKTIAC